MFKKITLSLGLLAAMLILNPSLVQASSLKSGNDVYLPQGETIDGNLYAASNNITIDGEVQGDLIAAAQTITINGRLEGDLIAAAQTITVNGEVNGNVRIAANSGNLNGNIARNVNFIGNSLAIGPKAKIGWDVLSGATNTNIMGEVNGNVDAGGNNIILTGKVGKDFNFGQSQQAQKITISSGAKIAGNLNYHENTDLQRADGSQISGQINTLKNTESKGQTGKDWFWSLLYGIFSAMIVGLIIIYPGKNIILTLKKIIREKPFASLGWGIITLLAAPTAAIILIFTIIGLPLAVIIFGLWLLMLWLGKIICAIIVGQEILNLFLKNKETEKKLLTSMIIGVTLLWLLFSIPMIGWVLSLIATGFGLGSLILSLRRN